jgi:hypothetical protein
MPMLNRAFLHGRTFPVAFHQATLSNAASRSLT